MKVGVVCPYDWSHPGGVRSHVLGLSAALRRRGIEVEVLAPASSEEDGIVRLGATLPIPYNGSIARIGFSWAAQRKLRAAIGDLDIDLLHLHEPAIPSSSLLALIDPLVPTVATFHASMERSFLYGAAKPVLRPFIDRVAAKIGVSEAAISFVSQYFEGPYELIPNGIDVERFRSAEPDPRLAELGSSVLFVGRPEPRKGFDVLVEAMERTRQTHDAPLVCTGGPKGLPPWVIGLGDVSDEELPGLYAGASVFCAPNTGGESFGIVLLEAMAANTPVVCSDIPGFREAAGDAAAYAPPGDAASVASRLTQILGDEAAAADLVRKGSERVVNFDWSRLSERVVKIYQQVL